MAVVDSNTTTTQDIGISYAALIGQSFTASGSYRLDNIVVRTRRASGSPSGSVRIHLYQHSGVYGTSSVPTGPPIASSNPIAFSSLPTAYDTNVTFTFAGGEKYYLESGQRYFFALDRSGLVGANDMTIANVTNGGVHHSGNMADTTNGTTWNPASTFDLYFVVNGTAYSRSTLTVNDVGFTPLVSSPTLYSPNPVTVEGISFGGWGGQVVGGNFAGAGPTSSAATVLDIEDVGFELSTDSISLVQTHQLLLDDIEVGFTADASRFDIPIVAGNVSFALLSDNIILEGAVAAASVGFFVSVENIALFQKHTLVVDDTAIGFTPDNINVMTGVMSDDVTFNVSIDTITLIQKFNLLVQDVSFLLSIDEAEIVKFRPPIDFPVELVAQPDTLYLDNKSEKPTFAIADEVVDGQIVEDSLRFGMAHDSLTGHKVLEVPFFQVERGYKYSPPDALMEDEVVGMEDSNFTMEGQYISDKTVFGGKPQLQGVIVANDRLEIHNDQQIGITNVSK